MTIEIRDPRFLDIVDESLELETLADGFRFTEGPIWHPRERHLTFSDIPSNRLHRWSEEGGLSVYREPAGGLPPRRCQPKRPVSKRPEHALEVFEWHLSEPRKLSYP